VPRSASCKLGVLAPAAAQLSEVEQGAAAARASLGQPAPGTGATPAPAAPTGAIFQLQGGFPAAAGASPLVGRPFMLLDASLDNILREAGIAQPAGVSSAATVSKTCAAGLSAPDCQRLVKAIASHNVGALKPDTTGTAQSAELSAGRTYFLWGATTFAVKQYTWHLPLSAKAGWTKVVLTPSNAVP